MPPRARVSKAQPAKKAAPVKRALARKSTAKVADLPEPTATTMEPRRRGRKPSLKLNKGSKVHAGVLDLQDNVAYCRVFFGKDNFGRSWGPSDLEIVEIDKFIAWLNEKNGKYNGGPRFVKIEVVGADTDQRANSGINKLYEEFFEENEDVRIKASLAVLFNESHGMGVSRDSDGKWVLTPRSSDSKYSGGWQVARLAEMAKTSFVRAREIVVDYVRSEIGDEMFSKLDFVPEEWAHGVDTRRAAAKAAAKANGAK